MAKKLSSAQEPIKENVVQSTTSTKSVQATTNIKYPLLPDLPNQTDPLYSTIGTTIPKDISWETSYPAVYNQLDTNSCTAQAMCGAVAFLNSGQFDPSRLFQFYNERKLTNSVNSDSGSTIGLSVKAANIDGICNELMWPFNEKDVTELPSMKCYQMARKNLFKSAKKIVIQNNSGLINTIKVAIFKGSPVLAGVVVFPSMEDQSTAETGIVPMPSMNNEPLGGHAIVLMGYYSDTKLIQFRNSWGSGWGVNGYGFFPEEYLEQYLMSAWVLEN